MQSGRKVLVNSIWLLRAAPEARFIAVDCEANHKR
jgi:hypothetical protein